MAIHGERDILSQQTVSHERDSLLVSRFLMRKRVACCCSSTDGMGWSVLVVARDTYIRDERQTLSLLKSRQWKWENWEKRTSRVTCSLSFIVQIAMNSKDLCQPLTSRSSPVLFQRIMRVMSNPLCFFPWIALYFHSLSWEQLSFCSWTSF